MYLHWENFEGSEDEDVYLKAAYVPSFGKFMIFDEETYSEEFGSESAFSLYLEHPTIAAFGIGTFRTMEDAQTRAFTHLMKMMASLQKFETRIYEQLKGNLDKISDELELLHVYKNEERGVQCVRDIVSDLRRGDITMAENTSVQQGDKIRAYPDIHQYLLTVFPEYAKWRG